ncbi:MAG: UDP-N-acetylmuramate dehydrogenase [Tissierellia bacterium]|nr:UDP-N-acetylmuramate dehydrogenase [Tissierellia bacterium]
MNKYIDWLNKEGFRDFEQNIPMKELTSFQLGGPADIVLYPKGEEETIHGILTCRKYNIPYMVIGKGTNLLISDRGLEGVVIALRKDFSKIEVNGNEIYAQSGALLKDVAEKAWEHSLTGMETLHGIPGSVGGAITMNAGAYGGETKDVVSSVRALTQDGKIVEYSNQEMAFRYRRSLVEDEGLIILGATYTLKSGNQEEIREAMDDFWNRRLSKQPLDMPSAGSTFKRPTGYFAGKLIDDSGLRGLRHGGAQVSEKHCGFVVNRDSATTKDVRELIEIIQKTVYDKFGVSLETEIKVIGR